ncbi:MAG: pilus assembly protein PilM [Polyangia bacterium]|jgi:general secretion pathway protein L|nr:pilus assembly protein PilM [Polyangia bacterium]
MAQRIHGIDLGSYLVKVAVMEVGFRQTSLRDIISVPVAHFANEMPLPAPAAEDISPGDKINGSERRGGDAEASETPSKAAKEPFGGSTAVIAALGEALLRAGDRADLTVLGLPGDMASLRVLEFPFHDQRKVSAVLGYELEGQIPYEMDQVVFQHQLSEVPGGGGRALVSIANIQRTEGLLALLGTLGVDPHAIIVAPLGYGYLGAEVGAQSDPFALLDIGHERTNLAVLRGNVTVLARTLSRGGAQITRGLSALYQIPEDRAAEIKHAYAQLSAPGGPLIPSDRAPIGEVVRSELLPLAQAVRQSLLGVRQREDLYPRRVLLCGGSSAIRGLPEWLAEELELPVEVALPAGAPSGVGARGQVLAVGLAQTAADRRLPLTNLRIGALGRKEEHSLFRKRALYFAWTAVLVLGLLTLNGFLALSNLRKEERSLRANLAQTTLMIFNRPINSEVEVTKRINTALKGKKASTLPIPEASAFALLSEISRQLPPKTEVTLNVTRLHIREGKIDFEGTVKDAKEVDKVVEALKKVKCFDNVTQGRVSEVTVREMVDGEVKSDKRRKFSVDVAHECM